MTTATTLTDFGKRLDRTAEDTEALLGKLLSDTLLPDEIARPKRLMDAMRYSTLGGGKRLRPFLVVESSAVFDVPREAALLAGAALECIHCYSLIHDDLPAMDNSDLRRGRPTLHKQTDDATAILAGDGLLTTSSRATRSTAIRPFGCCWRGPWRVRRASAAWSAARCSTSPARAASATASRSMSRACSR
jgi:geranylgeranyl pyrophosphate synthase